MAKLSSTVTVALLAALLVVAHAAAFRTTITTVSTDNYSGSERECREQVPRQGLSHCRMFMREKMHGGGRYDEIENYSQHLDQCCAQLRNVNERCRCPALEMEIERDQMGRQQKQQMMDTARDLPSMCKMGPQSCHFHSRYY